MDFGASLGVEGGGGGANGDAAAMEMGFRRHSVILASPRGGTEGDEEAISRRATGIVGERRRGRQMTRQ